MVVRRGNAIKTRWIANGAAAVLLALAACGTLPPSPVATEAFQKREKALHIELFWSCQPADAGGLLIEGVVEARDTAQPILGLRFAATAYDKDGRRLNYVVGFPDGLRIGYEGWTRFRVLVPRGQAAARVDLAYEYHLPPDNNRPLTQLPPRLPLLFRFATTEEYFGTIPDACRP